MFKRLDLPRKTPSAATSGIVVVVEVEPASTLTIGGSVESNRKLGRQILFSHGLGGGPAVPRALRPIVVFPFVVFGSPLGGLLWSKGSGPQAVSSPPGNVPCSPNRYRAIAGSA